MKTHQAAAAAAAAGSRKQGGGKGEGRSDSESELSDDPDESVPGRNIAVEDIVHKIGTDLDVDAKDAMKFDDPNEYFYAIQLVDDVGVK